MDDKIDMLMDYALLFYTIFALVLLPIWALLMILIILIMLWG
jgi:hypothetical protein